MEDRQTGHQDVPYTSLTCKQGQVLVHAGPNIRKYEFKTSVTKKVLHNFLKLFFTCI